MRITRLDIAPYAYHRSFPEALQTIPMFGPPGFGDYLDALDSVHGIPTIEEMRTPVPTRFALTEIEPGTSFLIGDVRVDTILAQHPVPCLSMRFPDFDIVYTADTAKTAELAEFCRSARLLLAEATYASPDGHDFSGHGHMSGVEAGQLAQESESQHLVLTHMSDYNQADETVANARAHYSGLISVAEVGSQFIVRENSAPVISDGSGPNDMDLIHNMD